MTILSNPLPLPYLYEHAQGKACREAGRPALIGYKGTYYLFFSGACGFYYSYDLADWTYHRNIDLGLYQPGACASVIGERLAFCASSVGKDLCLYLSDDPLSDQWEKIHLPIACTDPCLFEDRDGRLYLYYSAPVPAKDSFTGQSHQGALFGVELDRQSFSPVGPAEMLAAPDPEWLGFEASPTGSTSTDALHSPFMNRWHGRYYLQYAGQGGEGVYTSSDPLGPFYPQPGIPYTTIGQGGSTMTDIYGNLWHATRISYSGGHRIALLPAGLDERGILFCDQSFMDYPVTLSEGTLDRGPSRPSQSLYSYRAAAQAPYSAQGHDPELIFDEDPHTAWKALDSTGACVEGDLGRVRAGSHIKVDLADLDIPAAEVSDAVKVDGRYIDMDLKQTVEYILEGSVDGSGYEILKHPVQTNLSHACISFTSPKDLRFIRLTARVLPYDQDFAVSGLRVFGPPQGPAPETVKAVTAETLGDRRLKLSWEPSSYAIGYRIRYGIRPDSLYGSVTVHETTSVELPLLHAGFHYFAAVDAFGEGGLAEGPAQRIS